MAHARISEALQTLVLEPEPGVEPNQVLDRFHAPASRTAATAKCSTGASSRRWSPPPERRSWGGGR